MFDFKEEEPMVRIKTMDRNQSVFYPVNIEDLIEKDHPMRGIWEFVNKLDMTKYYSRIKAVEGKAGRTTIDPKILITIWVYSYSAGIVSAREISRLCSYHPAYKWLTAFEEINHHTISDFRVANKEALDELFIEVLGILDKEGFIDLDTVMQDGTKIKANAGIDTYRRFDTLEKHLEKAKKYIEETNKSEEKITLRSQKAKQRAAIEKKERLEKAFDELEKIQNKKKIQREKEQACVSTTDPEARKMKNGEGAYVSAYNVQFSTDNKEKIIVGVRVSQSANDSNELINSIEQVSKNFDREPRQVVADGSYTTRKNIIDMNGKDIDFIGSLPESVQRGEGQFKKRGVEIDFYPNNFIYIEETDSYLCPKAKFLKYEAREIKTGHTNFKYRADFETCKKCPAKNQCCPNNNKKGRSISCKENNPVVEKFNKKMQTDEAKEIYRQRGPVAEFPNAWIKAKIKLRQFSVRGLPKVGMEAMWAAITYNIQQWLRLSWKNKIILTSMLRREVYG